MSAESVSLPVGHIRAIAGDLSDLQISRDDFESERNFKMKKLFAILMCAVMTASVFSACGSEPDTPDTPDNDTPVVTDADNEEPPVEPETPEVTITDTLELLTNVWNNYPEDQKFAVAGGMDVMDGPGKYEVPGSGEVLDNMLGFPQDSEELIDDAASMIHMMNSNTFTGAAYRLKNADDAADLMLKIKDNIMARQWICGFPDKMIVASVGNYVISAFGKEEPIESFKTNLAAVYPDAVISYEESLM